MTWSASHDESERLANAAHEALRKGDRDGAAQLFARAARAEENALAALTPEKLRTFGITSVSTVALWYKSGELAEAERAAYSALAAAKQPEFAADQLRILLQSIWNEKARREAGVSFAPGQVLVSVDGGEIVSGGAPLDLIVDKVQLVQSLFYRTAEYLKDLPLRKRGPPKKELQERCRPWLFQAAAGSYQFAVAIQEPRQGKLFGDDLPDPSALTSTFLAILRASSEDPAGALNEIVQSEEYRTTFLKLTRNLAPTGKLFGRMEITGTGDTQPVVLIPASRTAISEVLKAEKGPAVDDSEVIEIRGVLRALDLNNDWLEITVEGGAEKISGVGDTVDDLIGPMVNHNVTVTARRRKSKLLFIDIESEE